MYTSFEHEAVARLIRPGPFGIEMTLLEKGKAIGVEIKMIDALGAVRIAHWLFCTGQFEYVRVFGANGDRVVNYEHPDYLREKC